MARALICDAVRTAGPGAIPPETPMTRGMVRKSGPGIATVIGGV